MRACLCVRHVMGYTFYCVVMGRYYHLGTLLMAKLDAAHADTEEAPILDEVSALLKQVSTPLA